MTRQPRIPEQIAAQIAAAGQSAAAKAVEGTKYDWLANITTDDLISIDPEAELRKGNQRESQGWMHGPGQLELLSTAYRRLVKLAGIKAKTPVNHLDKVKVKLVKGSKVVLIAPELNDVPDALPLNKYGSSAWVNLFELLAPARLTVETGWRERYPVRIAPEGTPMGPCLLLDLTRHLERVNEADKKKTRNQTKTSQKKSSQNQASNATQPAAQQPSPGDTTKTAQPESKP
jgi:hypothetical protein